MTISISPSAPERSMRLSEKMAPANPLRCVLHTVSMPLMKAMYRDARILILDEPTAVLTPAEVVEFFRILRSMRETGKTVILITHKLDEVLAVSDDVTVMRDGRVVGQRTTKETNAAELARL